MRTAHTLHLGFKVCAAAGKVCGTATHAVGGDAGYGLLRLLIYDGDERGANIRPKHKKIENNMIVIITGIKIINNTALSLAR